MISCRIVTPKGEYKKLNATSIHLTSINGDLTLLSNHMPLVTMLKISELDFVTEYGRLCYAVGGGLFYFDNNVATILCDSIEAPEEIDLDRAINSKERAERRLAAKDPNLDFKRAELSLLRALNRIKLKG